MSSPAPATDSTVAAGQNKREQRDRSYQIDKQIEEDSKKYRRECKILLLGGPYSAQLAKWEIRYLIIPLLVIVAQKVPASRGRVQ